MMPSIESLKGFKLEDQVGAKVRIKDNIGAKRDKGRCSK